MASEQNVSQMSRACGLWGEHEHCGGFNCACGCHALAELAVPVEGTGHSNTLARLEEALPLTPEEEALYNSALQVFAKAGDRTATAALQHRERVEVYLARHGLTAENYYQAGREAAEADERAARIREVVDFYMRGLATTNDVRESVGLPRIEPEPYGPLPIQQEVIANWIDFLQSKTKPTVQEPRLVDGFAGRRKISI